MGERKLETMSLNDLTVQALGDDIAAAVKGDVWEDRVRRLLRLGAKWQRARGDAAEDADKPSFRPAPRREMTPEQERYWNDPT
jgi:hypothetical protein